VGVGVRGYGWVWGASFLYNKKKYQGSTPLMHACATGLADCVQLLAMKRADFTKIDDKNRGCLQLARNAQGNNQQLARWLMAEVPGIPPSYRIGGACVWVGGWVWAGAGAGGWVRVWVWEGVGGCGWVWVWVCVCAGVGSGRGLGLGQGLGAGVGGWVGVSGCGWARVCVGECARGCGWV